MKCAAFSLLVFFVITLFGCNGPKASDKTKPTSVAFKNDSSKESIFSLINKRKEGPQNFSDSIQAKFDFSKNYTEKEISALNLDTTKIGLNEYYFLADQKFLKKEIDSTEFIIYYRHKFGDQLEKVLRVKKSDTVFDVILAMRGGDSFIQKISTEFTNDSIFKETLINFQSTQDDANFSSYQIDSIISVFNYKENLNFQIIKKDTFSFKKEILYGQGFRRIFYKVYSKPFMLQNKKCIWEYVIDNTHPHEGESGFYKQNLLEYETKKVLLNDGRLAIERFEDNLAKLFDVDDFYQIMEDINFDGQQDILVLNNVKSGSSGSFRDSYIYNKEEDKFEFSEFLSGHDYGLEIDKKTLSHTSRGGAGYQWNREIHFDENSHIKFVNEFNSSRVLGTDSMIFSYRKIINDTVVKVITDTISDPNIEFWDWQKKFK